MIWWPGAGKANRSQGWRVFAGACLLAHGPSAWTLKAVMEAVGTHSLISPPAIWHLVLGV